MDDTKRPAASDDMEWADVVRNAIHLMHEVVLADLNQLERLREEMVRRGLDLPSLIEPDQPPAKESGR